MEKISSRCLYGGAGRFGQPEKRRAGAGGCGQGPVSYTHLDVYKRQLLQLDAGVKHGIQNIGEQVHRHDDNGKQANAALYGGVIPRQDAGHDQ